MFNINIVTIFSPNWFNHFLVFAYSLFVNNDEPIKLYLLSDTIPEDQLDRAYKLCDYFGKGDSIEYCNMEGLYNQFLGDNVNVDNRFTKYTLYKLFMPYIIADDRILFLDGDTVVNGDLSEYYNTDFNNDLLVGCLDTGLLPGYKTSIGLQENDKYINAGSFLMNLNIIRKLKLADKWLDLCNNTFFGCHEQCIFNLTMKNRIQIIDAKYNVSLSTSLEYIDDDVKVMHYAGNKPWDLDTSSVPKVNIWDYYSDKYKALGLDPTIPKKIMYSWFR